MHKSSAAYSQESYQMRHTTTPMCSWVRKWKPTISTKMHQWTKQSWKKKKKPSIIPFESCFQNEKCYYILQVELQVTSRNTAKQYWKLFQLMFKAEGKRKLSNLSWGTNLLCGLKQCLILLVPLSAQLESITIYLETKTRSSVRFRCSLKVAFSLNTFQTIAK